MKRKITFNIDFNQYLIIELSYNTIIALSYESGEDQFNFLNVNKYSKSTTRQQNEFKKYLKQYNCTPIELDEREINIKFLELFKKFYYYKNFNDSIANKKEIKSLKFLFINGVEFLENIDKFYLKEKLNDTLKEKGTSKKINKI